MDLWRPWLALFGVSLAGVPLSRIAFRLNVDLGQQLMAYHKYGVRFETDVQSPGVRLDIGQNGRHPAG